MGIFKPRAETRSITDLTILLDRSGSMSDGKIETIGAINGFIKDQLKESTGTKLTLIQFDHDYQIDYEEKDITDVPMLNEENYIPRGFTALLDAIGKTIIATEMRIKEQKVKPESVVLVIVTDGVENSSREWGKSQIKNMIEEQKDWKFIFLGADQNAFLEAEKYGFAAGDTLSYKKNAESTQAAFKSLGKGINKYRLRGVAGQAMIATFNHLDAEEQSGFGAAHNNHLENSDHTLDPGKQ